jgi:hypothetical protein
VYLGYVIGGGELKIDAMNMEVIIKWLTHTNVARFRSFMGASWSLHKFIKSFLVVATPFHEIIDNDKSL